MDYVRKRTSVTHGALVGGTAPAEQEAVLRDEGGEEEEVEVVHDIGWHKKKPEEVEGQMAEGVQNDWLWLLMRRFDKVRVILWSGSRGVMLI